jgi:hypothetical protein
MMVGLSLYFLKIFMESYIPANETKTYLLHLLVYVGTFLAGLQQIFSKIISSSNLNFIGNGRKFVDDASRFV